MPSAMPPTSASTSASTAARSVQPDRSTATPGDGAVDHASVAATRTALRLAVSRGDRASIRQLSSASASVLVAAGAGDDVVAAIERLGAGPGATLPDGLPGSVAVAVGEAWAHRGRWDRALAALADAEDRGAAPDAVAWRRGLVHHLQGDLDAALTAFGTDDRPPSGPDAVLRIAWRATTRWRRGDVEGCRADVAVALGTVPPGAAPRARAATLVAAALLAAADGDLTANDHHYEEALAAARAAPDVLLEARIHVNRGSRQLEEGRPSAALAHLDLAVSVARRHRLTPVAGIALHNRATAHLQRGDLGDAHRDAEAATTLLRRIGSSLIAYPLCVLGDLHRLAGARASARAAYEEALDVARRCGDVQGLAPALGGLARVRVDDADEVAGSLAAEAVAVATGPARAAAAGAAGWVALARGDRVAALGHADDAETLARRHGDRRALADALTLRAVLTPRDPVAQTQLDEAARVHDRVGDVVAAAGVALLRTAPGRPDSAARSAADTLDRRDVPVGPAAPPGPLRHARHPDRPPVSVRTLGVFEVRRDGRPVPTSAWPSRKARDLLVLLLVRRGRPVPRDVLLEALWPDEDPGRTGSRLSVALSTLRGVLDPDKQAPPDTYVVADRDAIHVDLDHLCVDVEQFLDLADAGLRCASAGAHDEAARLLAAADRLHTGEFLGAQPYTAAWDALRTEVRAVAGAVLRARRDLAARVGDLATAERCGARLLEADPYDEDAHLHLIELLARAGRHGEARRRRATYERCMEELGIAPAPAT